MLAVSIVASDCAVDVLSFLFRSLLHARLPLGIVFPSYCPFLLVVYTTFWLQRVSAQDMATYARIDGLRPSTSIDDALLLFERDGVETIKVKKDTTASHLSDYEIQFRLKRRKVTFGISDYNSAKKRRTSEVYGYVRASNAILRESVEYVNGVLS